VRSLGAPASFIGLLLVAGSGCRVGYDELADLGLGGARSGPAGGSSGQGGSQAGTSANGGSTAGGSAGSGGDAGLPGSGGGTSGGGTSGGGTSGGGASGGGASGSAGASSGGAAGTGGCSPTGGEVCDGLDNDCANGVDDGVTCPATCRGVAYAGNGYMFCEAEMPWDSAQGACAAQGMHLVKVESEEENVFIGTTAFGVGTAFVWLGGNDLTVEASWHWHDGSPFWSGTSSGSAPPGVYTNWYPGYPGMASTTDCLEMRSDHTWDDKQCGQGKRYVCELL